MTYMTDLSVVGSSGKLLLLQKSRLIEKEQKANMNKIKPVNSSSTELFHEFLVCPVCLMSFSKLHSMASCEHQFCQNCCLSYINSQGQNFSSIKCLQEGCNEPFNQSLPIFSKIHKKTQQKIEKLNSLNFYSKNANFKSCKVVQCDGYFNKNNLYPKCNKCSQAHCKQCQEKAHQGLCQINLAESALFDLNYKRCPNCQTWIQKTYGCTYIDCKCGIKFCYVCNQLFQNDRCKKIYHLGINQKIKKQMQNFTLKRDQTDILIFSIKVILKLVLILIITQILCIIFMLFFLGLTLLSLFLESLIILVKQAEKIVTQINSNLKCLIMGIQIIFFPFALIFVIMVQIFFSLKHFCFKKGEPNQSFDQLDKLVSNSALYYLRIIGSIWNL